MGDLKKEKILYVPLEKATTPRDGRVLTNRWWAAHPEKGIVFYESGRDYWSPQCNHHKDITESLLRKMYPDTEAVLVKVVFLGHRGNCS